MDKSLFNGARKHSRSMFADPKVGLILMALNDQSVAKQTANAAPNATCSNDTFESRRYSRAVLERCGADVLWFLRQEDACRRPPNVHVASTNNRAWWLSQPYPVHKPLLHFNCKVLSPKLAQPRNRSRDIL